MNDHTRAATLEEWMEAALTMAEVEDMSDETVIPTWPEDVVAMNPAKYPQLTVGALRQWQAARQSGEPYGYVIVNAEGEPVDFAKTYPEADDAHEAGDGWVPVYAAPQPAVTDKALNIVEMVCADMMGINWQRSYTRDRVLAQMSNLRQMLCAAPQPQTGRTPCQQEGLLKLAELGRQCFEQAMPDGGDLEREFVFDAAIEVGVLQPEQRDEPCGDADECRCREYEQDFPATCYRVPAKYMPLLWRRLTRPEPPEVE